MTKLDVLNLYLKERLRLAADDIFQVIKDTILDYQNEIALTKEENRDLKQRLADVGTISAGIQRVLTAERRTPEPRPPAFPRELPDAPPAPAPAPPPPPPVSGPEQRPSVPPPCDRGEQPSDPPDQSHSPDIIEVKHEEEQPIDITPGTEAAQAPHHAPHHAPHQPPHQVPTPPQYSPNPDQRLPNAYHAASYAPHMHMPQEDDRGLDGLDGPGPLPLPLQQPIKLESDVDDCSVVDFNPELSAHSSSMETPHGSSSLEDSGGHSGVGYMTEGAMGYLSQSCAQGTIAGPGTMLRGDMCELPPQLPPHPQGSCMGVGVRVGVSMGVGAEMGMGATAGTSAALDQSHGSNHGEQQPLYCTLCGRCFNTPREMAIHKQRPCPLTIKERSARHRAKIKADPGARAIYLAKRHESYQKRKREGKITTTPIAELPTSKQAHLREQWRKYQHEHRQKQKVSSSAVNLTPPSMDTSDQQTGDMDDGHLDGHDVIKVVHAKDKPYRCGVCGKTFRYSGKFKEHQRIHTGERPYRCHVCFKSFNQTAHLKVHLRVHTGEKPYSCPLCGKRFSQSSQIKGHLNTHKRHTHT